MRTLFLTLNDNCKYKSSEETTLSSWVKTAGKESADSTALKKLLQNKADRLFALADELAERKDIGDCIFNADSYEFNTQDPVFSVQYKGNREFELSCGNVVGTIGYDSDLQLNISSRFGDSFLKYIVSRAEGFRELPNFGGVADTPCGYLWLLLYYWCIKFKRAYQLGLPKMYRTVREQRAAVKGKLDPVDFYLHKKTGKFTVEYREQSFSSPALQLFLTVFGLVRAYPFSAELVPAFHFMQTLCSRKKYSLQELLGVGYFSNPLYAPYNVLIDLSKKILCNNGLNTENSQKFHAVLFDVSMLFEYFVRSVLMRAGYRVQRKKDRRHYLETGGAYKTKHKLEPDLVIEQGEDIFIFDVKYKNFDLYDGIKREDLFQIHTYIANYAHDANVAACGFVYPYVLENGKKRENITVTARQSGREIPLHIVFLPVPPQKEYEKRYEEEQEKEFFREMTENEQGFLESFQILLNKKDS